MITSERPRSEAADEILGLYFPVLDHGFVALVDYMGNDHAIEAAARVSFGGGGTRKLTETRGLLRHLRRHKHTTPSEMVEVKLHCCMPMFIARQWIRHRTANVNEMSGRYSLIPMLFYTPPEDQFRKQSKSNKQGRGEEAAALEYRSSVERWELGRRFVSEFYEDLTAADVARELARIDLPLSTYTQWYWKIDLHNLLHFLTLRVDSHAQWEIQQYGKVIAGMVKRLAPISYEAWIDYDVCGVRLSRAERNVLSNLVKTGDQRLQRGDLDYVTEDGMEQHGLARREIDELLAKFAICAPTPDFELDLSAAKTGSYFEEKFLAAVPKAERTT